MSAEATGAASSETRGGRAGPASPILWRRVLGENGVQKWGAYLPLVFMVLFFALPVALTLVWSVFERTEFWMKPALTLFAYENFFTSARAENYLFSMLHSGAAVVISFAIGFPIAVFVRRRVPAAAQHRVILLFILPFMISELVRVFAMRPILGRNGLINTALRDLHDTAQTAVNWVYSYFASENSTGESLAIWTSEFEPITSILFSPLAVIIGDVISFLPFMVFSGFLAIEAVQNYVFEVCDDLGARPIRTFREIIVPLAAPGIFAGSAFIFVNGLGVALVPTILGGPGAVNAGLIANQAIVALDFPLAMAVSAIMIVTLTLLLYVGHRLFDLTRVLQPIS